jgi:peptidoglycan/LPS O-acetylase OafA/YrhL
MRLHFLDGLRGWAALVVLLSHLFQIWLIPLASPALMPIINYTPFGVLMDGGFAVFVFFGVSGFALGYPVVTATSRYRTLAILALTRYTRLTIPILASCLFAQVLWSAGLLFNHQAGEQSPNSWVSFFYNFSPLPGEIWRFALWDVYLNFNQARSWNGVLWTMSIEWLGSFYLFALLLIPVRWLRILGAIGLSVVFCQSPYFGFFCGYLLAEASLHFGWVNQTEGSGRRAWAGLALIATCVVAQIFSRINLAELQRAPDLHAIQVNLTVAVGMLGIVLSSAARSFLSTRTSTFLGDISFSLYLVHLPIIFSFGCGLYLLLASEIPSEWMLIVVGVPTVALCLVLSVVFRAIVEERLVVWAKRTIVAIFDRAIDTGRKVGLFGRQARIIADRGQM